MPAPAAQAVGRVLRTASGFAVVKKIDSLLGGNIAAEVAELTRDGSPVIVAAGLPTLGRTVIDGVPLVGGSTPGHADLDLIVSAAQEVPRARLVGTSALTAALARIRGVQEVGSLDAFAIRDASWLW